MSFIPRTTNEDLWLVLGAAGVAGAVLIASEAARRARGGAITGGESGDAGES